MQIKPSDIDFHIDGEINTSCFQHLFQKLQRKTTKKKKFKTFRSSGKFMKKKYINFKNKYCFVFISFGLQN